MGHSLVLTKGCHGVYSNIGHLFTFIKIIRRCCLHALTRNLGKKVCKKWNFIISAPDGGKPVIKWENSGKSGNVGISVVVVVVECVSDASNLVHIVNSKTTGDKRALATQKFFTAHRRLIRGHC